jgi:hypothetical protein
MIPLDEITVLIGELASAIGLATPPPRDDGGYRIILGEDTDVLIYVGNDETILVIVPIMKLPFQSDYAVALYLLRVNMIDSPIEPFRAAADAAGGLVLWARLPIARLDGPSLAALTSALVEYVTDIRKELEGRIAEIA